MASVAKIKLCRENRVDDNIWYQHCLAQSKEKDGEKRGVSSLNCCNLESPCHPRIHLRVQKKDRRLEKECDY